MARGACRSIGASRRLKLPADAPPGRLKCLGELVIQGALEARASGAFVQVPSMASSCTRPPCAPQYARSARLGGRSERAALLEPRPAGARSVRGGWWERRGGAARAARDRVGRVGGLERSAGRLDSAGRLRRHGTALTLSTARRWPLARLLPVQARAGTGPFGADVTFLVGSISSRRSIGAPSRSLASPSGGIPVPQPAPQSPACSLLPACARTYAVLTGLPSYSGGRRSEVRATRSTTLGLATRAREFFYVGDLIFGFAGPMLEDLTPMSSLYFEEAEAWSQEAAVLGAVSHA